MCRGTSHCLGRAEASGVNAMLKLGDKFLFLLIIVVVTIIFSSWLLSHCCRFLARLISICDKIFLIKSLLMTLNFT